MFEKYLIDIFLKLLQSRTKYIGTVLKIPLSPISMLSGALHQLKDSQTTLKLWGGGAK